MPILTTTEISDLATELGISNSKATGLVAQAQAIIESPLGCDRALELTEFKTIKQLNFETQSCYLDYLPIDTTAPITVRARLGNSQDFQSGLPIPQQPWVDFDSDRYNLDLQNGELSLNISNSTLSSYYGAYGIVGSGFTHGSILTECEVTYTSGFNFDPSNGVVTAIAESIKAQFIGIVNYMASGIFSGEGTIAKERIDQEQEVTYHQAVTGGRSGGMGGSRGAGVGQIPDALLIPFKKYVPNLYEF